MYKILSTCKGGGYMYCRTNPPHPKNNSKGLYPLHRVLVENKIGRGLLPNEEVHHKDNDKTNNNVENLEVLTKSEHAKIHSRKVDEIIIICECCKNEFRLKPHEYRLRKKRNKSNQVYCSSTCGGIMSGR